MPLYAWRLPLTTRILRATSAVVGTW
jgi:hypothetical protein